LEDFFAADFFLSEVAIGCGETFPEGGADNGRLFIGKLARIYVRGRAPSTSG
jgi:hypothetical protein